MSEADRHIAVAREIEIDMQRVGNGVEPVEQHGDYLYIPLGGNRVPRGRWIFNIAVVWAAPGLNIAPIVSPAPRREVASNSTKLMMTSSMT